MTIALVIPSLPQYSETFLINKISGLKASGFSVILLVVGVSKRLQIDVPVYYQPILASQGLMRWIHVVWLLLKSFLLRPAKSLKLLSEAKNAGYEGFGRLRMLAVLSNFIQIKADWIHFAFGTMAVERAFVGKVLGARVGMSIRGYDIAIAPVVNPGLYRNVWPFINKVHSISNDLISVAKSHGMPTDMPYEIISPAIEPSIFENKSFRKWHEKPKFLTVSRLHWKKGLTYTLAALAKLDFDFEFTIIGEGPERERLIFTAHQLGIGDRVSFVGKKTQSEIVAAMHTHDFYLQYSVQEGFCNAVLEAQAAGMLCIVSDAEGLHENVLHNETGWVVEKRQPEKLAKRIIETLQLSESIKNAISHNAAKRISTTFTLKEQASKFEHFFKYE